MRLNILILLSLMLICMVGAASALTNLQPNGDFESYPNVAPVTSGWIGNASVGWNVWYNDAGGRAYIDNGNLVVISGATGSHYIYVGDVPNTSPTLQNWQDYGTEVAPNTQYTAFAYCDVNKTSSIYLNIKLAYENGTNQDTIFGDVNTNTGPQLLQETFVTPPNTKYCRVSIAVRTADTYAEVYSLGLFQGTASLNQPTQVVTVAPNNELIPRPNPTFEMTFYDVDCSLGVDTPVELVIGNNTYPGYTVCDGIEKSNVFFTSGTHTFYANILDEFGGNTSTPTYTFFIPDIQYIADVSTLEETEHTVINLQFYYMIFILALLCLILSFVKTEGFDARVIFTLSGAVMFICLALGAFGTEIIDASGNGTVIYSTSFSYVALFFTALLVVRLIILVTAMLRPDNMEDNIEYYDDLK